MAAPRMTRRAALGGLGALAAAGLSGCTGQGGSDGLDQVTYQLSWTHSVQFGGTPIAIACAAPGPTGKQSDSSNRAVRTPRGPSGCGKSTLLRRRR